MNTVFNECSTLHISNSSFDDNTQHKRIGTRIKWTVETFSATPAGVVVYMRVLYPRGLLMSHNSCLVHPVVAHTEV